MNLVVNNHNIFVIVLVTFLTSLILVPIMKKVAIHINAMDEPNERKIHKVPKPRLGGLAIYFSFLLGYILYGEINTQMISILIASFLLIIVGIFDDINSVPARYKFLVQVIAASIVVIYGNLGFTEISFLGLKFYFNHFINDIIAIIFIVGITNAINLIDGLDGLAAGLSSIYFISPFIAATANGLFSKSFMMFPLSSLSAYCIYISSVSSLNFSSSSVEIYTSKRSFILFISSPQSYNISFAIISDGEYLEISSNNLSKLFSSFISAE